MYKVGDKVVVVWPDNRGPDGNFFAGGPIGEPRDAVGERAKFKEGEVIELLNNFGRYWGIKDRKWVLDERAFKPYKEEPVKDPYENITFEAAYKLAQERNIYRRGRMSKAQLIAALRVQENAVKPAVPAKPAVEDKPVHVPSLGEKLRKQVGNGEGARTCSYAMRRTDGVEKFHVRDVCHARLSYGPFSEIVLDVAEHLAEAEDKEAYKDWVHWVLNASPMAKCFITKRIEDAMREGVYLDVTQPHSWNVTAAVLLRMGSEYPQRLKVWKTLVENKVDKGIAWLLMSFYVPAAGGMYMQSNNGGGHDIVSPVFGFMQTLAFLKNGPINPGPASNVHNGRYEIFASVVKNYGVYDDKGLSKQLYALDGTKQAVGWGEAVEKLSLGGLFRLAGILEEKLKNIV
jgi:hypothetical protein